jgi:hypothetical protein
MTVAREIARYKLDLMGAHDVRRENEGTVRAGDYTFFYRKEIKVINWEQVCFLYTRE